MHHSAACSGNLAWIASRSFDALAEARAWLAPLGPAVSATMPAPAAEVMDPESAALVAAARDGDGRAFAELVRLHAARVTQLVARFTRSRADLEDISQEVFIEVHRCLGRYDARAPLEHWIARIATRRCYDHLRRHYRRRWLMPWTSLGDGEDGSDMTAAPAAENEDPRVERLRAAIAALPPEQRLVITLLELDDQSVREVAALTGWSDGNVKVRAYRAREALRRALVSSSEQS